MKRHLARNTFFKLLSGYFLIIIIVVIPILLAIWQNYKTDIEHFYENYSYNMTTQIYGNIDQKINSFEFNTFYNLYTSNATTISSEDLLYHRTLYEKLTTIAISSSYMLSISYVLEDECFCVKENSIIDDDTGLYLINLYQNSLAAGQALWVTKDGNIYLLKRDFDASAVNFTGYFIFEIKPSFFSDIFSGNELGEYFVYYNDTLIYQTGADSSLHDITGYISTVKEENEQLRLVNFIPKEVAQQSTFETIRAILVASLLVVLFVVILSYLLSQQTAKKVSLLRKKMEHIENGQLTGTPEIQSKDEFRDIETRLHLMNDRIQSLLLDIQYQKNTIHEAKLNTIKSEYFALQNQFNPHLLYNALEGINVLAKLENRSDLSESIVTLADFYREISKNKATVIRLEDELHYIHNFLKINLLVAPESFSYEEEIDPDTTCLYVPKLSIQPLVDNAIRHGISHKKNAIITLVTYKTDHSFCVSVSDNGNGCAEDILNNTAENHTGLYNINRRIKMLYGESFGLQLQSEPENGTNIIVTLPLDSEAL